MHCQINDRKGASALVAHLKIDVQELIREVQIHTMYFIIIDIYIVLGVFSAVGLSAVVGILQARGVCSEIFRLHLQLPRKGQ